jgi:predicted RNase H-like nuclease (RuvC/YqgF family)
MPREIVTGDSLGEYIESKLNKKPMKEKEEYKAKTPAEKGRLFDKIKNEMGLVGAILKPQLDKLKSKFTSGKVDEAELREQLKMMKAPAEKEEMPVEQKETNSLADIASKKM